MPIGSINIGVHAKNNSDYKELCEKFRLSKFPSGTVINWNRGTDERDPKEYVHLYHCDNEDNYDKIATALADVLSVFKRGDKLIDGAVEKLNDRIKPFLGKEIQ